MCPDEVELKQQLRPPGFIFGLHVRVRLVKYNNTVHVRRHLLLNTHQFNFSSSIFRLFKRIAVVTEDHLIHKMSFLISGLINL